MDSSLKKDALLVGALVGGSFFAGAVFGFFVTKKELEKKYVEISNMEIADAKAFYSRLYKREEYQTPEDAVTELISEDAAVALRVYSGEDVVVSETVEGVTTVNVFDQVVDSDEGWDYEKEVEGRSTIAPYIIHKDEFNENAMEYEQSSITFYEGDDVLTDDKDKPIPDVEEVVGEDNLMKFGHGSGDNNVVYVRNDRIEMDFQIHRSTGKYTEEVLGFVEHSDRRPKIRRFRGEDE